MGWRFLYFLALDWNIILHSKHAFFLSFNTCDIHIDWLKKEEKKRRNIFIQKQCVEEKEGIWYVKKTLYSNSKAMNWNFR